MRSGRLALGAASAVVLVVTLATPAAAANPSAVVGHTESFLFFSHDFPATIAGPTLGAGTWWITATAVLDATQSAVSSGETLCQLTAGSVSPAFDHTTRMLDFGHVTGRAVSEILLTGGITSTGSFRPTLKCSTKAATGNVSMTDIDIDAINGSTTTSGAPRFKFTSAADLAFGGDSVFHTVGTVQVPAGRWSVLGRADIKNPSLSVPVNVTCRLRASSLDIDKTTQSLGRATQPGSAGEVAVEVAHNFSAATTLKLECRGDSAGGFDVVQSRLVAVDARKLTRGPFGGTATTSGSGTPVVISGFRSASSAAPTGTIATIVSLPLP